MSEEDDLDDLDDFLDDFQDELLEDAQKKEAESKKEVETKEATPDGENQNASDTSNIELELQKQFEQLLIDMSMNDPKTSDDLKSVMDDLKSEANDKKAGGSNFQNAISETISRLKTSGEQVDQQIKQEQPDELLTQLLSSLGGGDPSGLLGGSDDISKLLVEMLDQLSSKKVLYEPIKELNDKYPAWLETNREKLSAEEHDNYSKQYDICSLIVTKFDDPQYDETDEATKEFIATKLEEMQELGMPPSELMNQDLSMLPGFGGSGTEGVLPELPKELDDTCQQQ
ncbi:unnamed protein product [Kuraishia capsulata CBS 1993]|uniref:Uncharacterized protein n=1 Tax=Kuraishia capsulata CBS 1993 TaxID=1382522 RepID=W6MRH8_9ASCO|nr:uncharacterized protein KUCA_T00000402001 [Kuraishia capsulata CBS 1993]CDK24440.1 unnamed protein product [Kuraishia capsulata CBS 1993]